MTVDRRLETWTEVMAKLGVAFDKVLDQPQLDLYWEQLRDIQPPDLLLSAATKWIHEQSRFPRIADLRDYCDRCKPPARRLIAASLDGEPTYHCLKCEDREGAWEPFTKFVDLYGCEVSYVRRCSCYDSNPVHRARLDQQRRFHADQPKRFRS